MQDNYTLYSRNDYYTIVEVSGYTTPAEAIGGSVSVVNGLSKYGSSIGLGGDLSQETIIKGGNAYSIALGEAGGNELTSFNIYTTGFYNEWNAGDGIIGLFSTSTIGEGSGGIQIVPYGIQLNGGNGTNQLFLSNYGFQGTADHGEASLTGQGVPVKLIGQVGGDITSIILTPDTTHTLIIDSTNANFAGIQYASNFNSNFTNRSLVDLGFVTGVTSLKADITYVTDNTVLLTTNQTVNGKKSFTPTATLAGLNIGSSTNDPTTLSNGDLWLNGSNSGIKFQVNNTAYYMAGLVGSANNTGRIPIETSNRGILTDASNLTFASNTLTAGNTVSIVGGSINSPGGGNLGFSSGGAGSMMLGGSDGAGSTTLSIGAGGTYNFTSTNTPSGSSPDTSISRAAAGVLTINTTSKNGLGRLVLGSTTITNSSAIVDLQATDKSLILTRVATEGNITTPVNGMIYYNSTDHKFRGYANGTWVDLN